jgi:hypothetical protein
MTEAHFQHSYDNDGGASLQEEEPYYYDEDQAYEQWRENGCEEFEDKIKIILREYLNKQNHYMNNKYHLISGLESILDDLKQEGFK